MRKQVRYTACVRILRAHVQIFPPSSAFGGDTLRKAEDDLAIMMENIQFRKVSNEFLDNLNNDLRKVKSSPNVFVFADKTRNVYETSPENYRKIVTENITKTYKIAEHGVLDDINNDLKHIADELSISDRIETMAPKDAFITFKDHKENFQNNPKFRLINPAKSELGKISKTILDNINSQIKNNTGLNQWKNSLSVIEWFKNIDDKPRNTFLSFDIADFYPSITENLLNKAILWAKNDTSISDKEISIIKHARSLCSSPPP